MILDPLEIAVLDNMRNNLVLDEYLKALVRANSLLTSTYVIAEREGKDTNWESFKNNVKECLDIQHKLIYPDTYKST